MTSEDSRSRVPDPPHERGRCTLSRAQVPRILHEGKPQDGTARPPASHPRSSSIGEEQSWQKSDPHAWCPRALCSQRGTERAAGIEPAGRRGPPHSPGCFRFCGQRRGPSPRFSPTSTFPNGATVTTSGLVLSHGFPVIHLHFLRDLGSCREVYVPLSSFALLLHFVGRTSESRAMDLNYPSCRPRRLYRGPQ